MIEVTVRYDRNHTVFAKGPGNWPAIREVILDLRDRVESAVAQICEKEQEHVDVSLVPYDGDDEHGRDSAADDILIKIDVDACDAHGNNLSADSFTATLVEQFQEIFGADAPRPRVWVRPIVGGSFAE